MARCACNSLPCLSIQTCTSDAFSIHPNTLSIHPFSLISLAACCYRCAYENTSAPGALDGAPRQPPLHLPVGPCHIDVKPNSKQDHRATTAAKAMHACKHNRECAQAGTAAVQCSRPPRGAAVRCGAAQPTGIGGQPTLWPQGHAQAPSPPPLLRRHQLPDK